MEKQLTLGNINITITGEICLGAHISRGNTYHCSTDSTVLLVIAWRSFLVLHFLCLPRVFGLVVRAMLSVVVLIHTHEINSHEIEIEINSHEVNSHQINS